MPLLRALYDTAGWAYYRRVAALQKYAPKHWRVTIGSSYGHEFARRGREYDVVLQLCYGRTSKIRQHMSNLDMRALLVTGYNRGWDGSAELAARLRLTAAADHVVINNRGCWDAAGRPPKTSWISNGVDLDEFRISRPVALRKPNVIWLGSKVHARTKGYHDLVRPLEKMLRANQIRCDFRLVNSHRRSTWLRGQRLIDWYNEGTIYLVASRNEGTPNPALEAAACGCVVVATPVGNMPELIQDGVNGFLVQRRSPQAMLEAVLEAVRNYRQMAEAMQQTIQAWHWKARARRYFDLFDRLLKERDNGLATKTATDGNGERQAGNSCPEVLSGFVPS